MASSANLTPFQAPRTLPPIRVAPGGRYFETADEEPFHFLGVNDAISWVGLNGLFNRRDPESAERYLACLAENGVTVIRLMLEYTHRESRYFEKPVGRFVPAMVRLWDDLLSLCATYGLRVLLTPFDTFWMARRWHRHPYNQINGGPAATPQSMLTDEGVIQAVMHRMRFVAERWGGTGIIAGWDLWNEIHPHWGGTPQEQAAALRRIGDDIRTHEERHHGFSLPQTVSIFGPDPADYYDLIFRGTGMDFATTHIYQGAIDFPKDTVQPALLMAQWVRHACAHTTRPFTDTEHGPIHLFNDHRKYLPEPFDDEYERRLMWAHLASGGAGSGMRWPARDPHTVTAGMLRSLRGMSRFLRECGIDWRTFSGRDAREAADLSPEAGEHFHRFAVADDRHFLMYMLRGIPRNHRGAVPDRPALTDVPVTIAVVRPGRYTIRIWDTRNDTVLIERTAMTETVREKLSTADGEVVLRITLPVIHEEAILSAVYELA